MVIFVSNLRKIFQAIKCFVANVIPAEGNWSSDCMKATKPLLMEQYCSIKIIDILEEEVVTFAVEVELPNSGKICLFKLST